MGGRDQSERLVAINRNSWSRSFGARTFAIGYAMSRTIGTPIAQLLTNAQLARNGNVELIANVNTGSRELEEKDLWRRRDDHFSRLWAPTIPQGWPPRVNAPFTTVG